MNSEEQKTSSYEVKSGYEEPASILNVDPTLAGHEASQASKGHKKQKKAKRTWLQRARGPMSLFTLVILFATVGQVIVGWLQWDATDGQLQVMRKQNEVLIKQTDTMAKQTKLMEKQTEVMADSLDEARRSGEKSEESMKSALSQNRDGLRSTLGHGQKALDFSIAASQLDQRPWVLVVQFALPSELEDGKPIHVEYWLQNTGKTPALDEFSQSRLLLSNQDPPMTKFTEPITKIRSISVVPPGNNHSKAFTDPFTWTSANIADYRSKKLSLYFHGRLTYRDVFTNTPTHWTTVCAYHIYGSPLNEFRFCGSGNDMDRN